MGPPKTKLGQTMPLSFRDLMARCIDELEMTPCPRVLVAGNRRYIRFEQAIRLTELLTRK